MRDFDYSDSADFLAAFFGATTVHAVEIRALPNEHGGGPNRAIPTRDPSTIMAHCQRWDGPGRAVFFGVATRLTGSPGGKRADLAELPALWADIDTDKLGLDKIEAVHALEQMAMPPSLIIDSGGGIHPYWLLRESLDVRPGQCDDDAIIAALKQLAGICAGDTAVCDLARVMRLPGTHNTKTDELRPVSVLRSPEARYEFDELVEMLDWHRPVIVRPATAQSSGSEQLPNNPFTEFAARYGFKPPLDVEALLSAMSYMAAADNGIHQTQLRVSASLVSHGMADDQIVEMLLAATQHAAGLAGENWNWKREESAIRRMTESARKKFAAAVPAAPRASAKVIQLRTVSPQEAEAPDSPETRASDPDGPPAPEMSGAPLNDLGNAARLILRYGGDLRYVVGMGWHAWDGRRFKNDPEDIEARKLAHATIKGMLDQAFDLPQRTDAQAKTRKELLKFAVASGNSNKITGMLSQAEPHLAVVPDDLDKDALLLNCQNGTVDLRTGELRAHSRDDLLTKICGASYDPTATCPIWEKFLLEIFGGDDELVKFVQRAIGYSLTGLTSEQVVFILQGAGSNGKSVLIETIAAVLDDYVKRSPSDTWVSKQNNGPTNDIAALAGARFVSVVETEHDKQLAEALVKQATGGDAMTARFHYKEWFSFIPKFKLWFATNHKPKIRGSEYAIWRRILLLPFTVTFVDEDKLTAGQKVKDPDLKNKLAGEFNGILARMVRGCLDWQRIGLQPPDAVVQATEAYQDSQDNVSGFIRDNCHVSSGLQCTIGLLHAGYVNWCAENDESAVTMRVFSKNLDDRGFPPQRDRKIRFRKGIDLQQEYVEAAQARLLDKGGSDGPAG